MRILRFLAALLALSIIVTVADDMGNPGLFEKLDGPESATPEAVAGSEMSVSPDDGHHASRRNFSMDTLEPCYKEPPIRRRESSDQNRLITRDSNLPSQDVLFRRGDADVNHEVTVSDAVVVLVYIYVPGGPIPACIDACDIDDDGEITMVDAIYLVKYLYVPGSPSPPSPFPGCGPDPTPDGLGCNSYSACGNWVGQGQVNEPDELFDSQSRISAGSAGVPWVVWKGRPSDGRMHIYSVKWEGDSWSPEMVVVPDTSREDHNAAIDFDNGDYPIAAWMRQAEGFGYEIWYARWNGVEWIEGGTVHSPHPFKDSGPRMASGGGETWIIWRRRDAGDSWTSEILASRWNGAGWDSVTIVCRADSLAYPGGYKDVAVDAQGTPHVVWSTYPGEQEIFYSTFDGVSWSEKMQVSTSDSEEDLDPGIASDSAGNLHVVWAARTPGTPYGYELFYSRYDAMSWSDEIQINDPDLLGDYMPRIAANSPDNVWVTWDGVDGGGEYHVYAICYDGSVWSSEQRLDDDNNDWDYQAYITLGANGAPYVVWSGLPVGSPNFDIFCNRYETTRSW